MTAPNASLAAPEPPDPASRAVELDAIDLPRPPGALRRLMHAHPAWVDSIIAGLYVLGSIGLAILGGFIPETEDGPFEYTTPDYLTIPQILLLILIVAITSAALLLRRKYPLSSLAAVLVVSVFAPEDMVPVAAVTVAVAVLLYSVPVFRSVRAGWLGYGLAVVASLLPVPFMGDIVSAEVTTTGEVITVATTTTLLLLIPVMIGINAGNRRRYTEAIIDRAHQLARERDQRARLAVAEERTRIAREMHDIVAHSVSVMVTLSEGAAQVVELAPTEAKSAMLQSAEAGRSALTEMRRLIGVLRNSHDGAPESPELAPTPGIEALPDLIHNFRAAGLTVNLTLAGSSATAVASAEQGRELAIYRTVQEALTNTLRYAGPGAAANVVVEQGETETVVRIEDDGGVPGQSVPMTGVGSGHGLIGLGERLRVLGGALEHGPTLSGGWHVTATLPSLPDDDRKEPR